MATSHPDPNSCTRSSAQINAEIFNHGAALFERIRHLVQQEATVGTRKPGAPSSEANRRTLAEAVARVCAAPKEPLSADHVWQVFWRRIAYAGTKAQKATTEIASMQSAWIFRGLDAYSPGMHAFARAEWEAFVEGWRRKVGKKDWLVRAKAHGDWHASLRIFVETTPAEWQLMVKDASVYPNLSFSSHAVKMEKYVRVAEVLASAPQADALRHFTRGAVFAREHAQGEDYLRERELLDKVHGDFASLLGRITALHAMMDLGLKTVKPDRVMAYLFSQLGWLQTLPANLSKRRVMGSYMAPQVVSEVCRRADVLAARLAQLGLVNTHRLLDIWFVKFGQEPEVQFGITRNLQAELDGGIAAVYSEVLASASPPLIDDHEAAARWPGGHFSPLSTAAVDHEEKPAARRRSRAGRPARIPRAQAERALSAQWRPLHEAEPLVFPNRLDNEPKEALIRLIERGLSVEDAFLQVLQAD